MIRDGTLADLPDVYQMNRELAIYENAEDQLVLPLEQFIRDSGLDPDQPGGKHYHLVVAAPASSTADSVADSAADSVAETGRSTGRALYAYALFFYTYSSWEGRALYAEDVFVRETARKGGLGTRLMKTLAKIAIDAGCQRFQWICLDWNKASLDFYTQKLKAVERVEEDGGKWCNMIMRRARMEELAGELEG